MPVYENVPLVELDQELLTYKLCWGTVVLAGVAIEEGGKFFPMGAMIWSENEVTKGTNTKVYGTPDLPEALKIYRIATEPILAFDLIKRIFNRESVQVGEMTLYFQHCVFGRAAFLGAYDYEYIYPKELKPRVNGWPALFFEGGFENREALQKRILEVNKELEQIRYKYHTLRDATNHLIEFPFSPAYYMGGLSGVLNIPVRIQAKVEGRQLRYSLIIPKALKGLTVGLRYVARSDKGERDESLSLPSVRESGNQLEYSSLADLNPGDTVTRVVLVLNGKPISSAPISEEKQIPTYGAATPPQADITPRQGKIFIVHGSNHTVRDEIKTYLIKDLSIPEDMIEVLEMEPYKGRTLIEKFEDVASRCRFAIIILSGDDVLWIPPLNRERRARQNVILELGFFWGRLGRQNLALLVDSRIKRPSDIDGVGYIPITGDLARTKVELQKELKAAGLIVTLVT